MKVRDIMTTSVRTCRPSTSLAEAGAEMLGGDCGILPVVENGTLVGVITDRDVCIALATRNQPASELTVGDVARTTVWTCTPEDDVQTALETMKAHQVRRLPVVAFGNTLVGMLSMNDIVRAAGSAGVRGEQVIDTLKAICGHPVPVRQTIRI